ncbi:MAG: MmcQ/YjbR family DNA-binding protein [Actinomycetota bacterium]
MPNGESPLTYDDVVALVADWPGIAADNWYGTPGLKVGGKGFARMWSQREYDRNRVHDTEVLVVLCDVDEKAMLIESANGVLFSTPHYDGHGSMLVRLADVDRTDLAGYLEDGYRTKATARLLAAFET